MAERVDCTPPARCRETTIKATIMTEVSPEKRNNHCNYEESSDYGDDAPDPEGRWNPPFAPDDLELADLAMGRADGPPEHVQETKL